MSPEAADDSLAHGYFLSCSKLYAALDSSAYLLQLEM